MGLVESEPLSPTLTCGRASLRLSLRQGSVNINVHVTFRPRHTFKGHNFARMFMFSSCSPSNPISQTLASVERAAPVELRLNPSKESQAHNCPLRGRAMVASGAVSAWLRYAARRRSERFKASNELSTCSLRSSAGIVPKRISARSRSTVSCSGCAGACASIHWHSAAKTCRSVVHSKLSSVSSTARRSTGRLLKLSEAATSMKVSTR
mmetsp:Transcript_63676/g.105883  ORF Transcript_63676/g.105883 Transcript_63676/m.105883 type:complete len:208 (-) Transcript_63676:598-1221(-)